MMPNAAHIEYLYGTPAKPWVRPDGSVIACVEKLRVMQDNFAEIRQIAQDTIDDAVLMGCDERQVKDALTHLVQSLSSAYSVVQGGE